jgi:Lrp/AsnC family transcriptional regulator of ectoine degradation
MAQQRSGLAALDVARVPAEIAASDHERGMPPADLSVARNSGPKNLDAATAPVLNFVGLSRGARTGLTKTRSETPRLDARDVKILAILQREGRISKAALAERVNLSATPCWERLRRLEEAGIIESYGAQISVKVFGPVATVFVEIEIESHRSEDFARFEGAVARIPEIVECWAVGGGIDYLCKVVVRNLADYQALVERLLADNIGIRRYYSYVVTSAVKNEPIPVDLFVQPTA